MRRRTIERYGVSALPADSLVQDWGVRYDELEPHYDTFERVCGVSGKAGNIKGRVHPGGNPFEGPRSREFPTPPLTPTYDAFLFGQAATSLGYHPFPRPSSTLSEAYENPDGQASARASTAGSASASAARWTQRRARTSPSSPPRCARAGSISRRRCERAQGQPGLDTDPRRERDVPRPSDGARDGAAGRHHLPDVRHAQQRQADAPLGDRAPVRPATGKGVVGRSYAYQVHADARLFFEDKVFNPFMGTGSVGTVIDDFNGDNFDHAEPRLHRGWQHQRRDDWRQARRDPPHASGHAALGFRLEEGGRTLLRPQHERSARRSATSPTAAISWISTRSTGTPTACRCCASPTIAGQTSGARRPTSAGSASDWRRP